MKIGILTFHYAHNYGAMLQAYALTYFLRSKGFDAEIVDYRLHYIYRNHEKYDIKGYYQWLRESDGVLISALKVIKSYRKHRKRTEKWYKFEEFMNTILYKSKRMYSLDVIENYNFLICGSDQIWNSSLTGGYNTVYWGNTIPNNVKMITYAASNGNSCFKDISYANLKKQLERYNAISIREKPLVEWLNDHLHIHTENVCDPIFLLNKREWNYLGQKSSRHIDKPYLLIYAFQEDLTIYQIAKNIADKLNLQIISLCYKKRKDIPFDCKQDDSCGPLDFIYYITNATFVCTTSFHGVAFSILFNKQFYSLLPKNNNDRVVAILDKFELSERCIKEISDVNVNNLIDYKVTNKILNKEQQSAWKYLDENLR